jgi:hypothetical protein
MITLRENVSSSHSVVIVIKSIFKFVMKIIQ